MDLKSMLQGFHAFRVTTCHYLQNNCDKNIDKNVLNFEPISMKNS